MTVLPHGAESSHTFSLSTLAPGSVFPTSSALDALPWLCHHVPPDYHYLVRNFKAATLTHSEVTPSLESFLLFDNQGSLLPAQGFITTPTLSSELLVDGNLIDNLGYPPISLLVRQVDAAVLAEPQEVYIPVGILSAFRSLGFCSKSVPSCMDDRQLLAHYTTPARLVESMDSSWSLVTSGMSRHERFLEDDDYPLEELPLSDTATTLSTPEAVHVQLTGVECHNPPRFIFYPISWDESDGLLMSTEVDGCSGTNLETSVDRHIPELHDDESDPLSAVIYHEDPYESVDPCRRDIVDCHSLLCDDSLEHWEGLESILIVSRTMALF